MTMLETLVARLVQEHDLRLVALAALVCALGSFSGIILLTHVRRITGRERVFWLIAAAAAAGSGIWATHFIAMLAFHPGFELGYDIGLTVASLVIAVIVPGVGLWLAAIGRRRSDAALGGIVIGLGISAMHYTGMASLIVGGAIQWDPSIVLVSIAFGAVFGGMALWFGFNGDDISARIKGALLLTLAICTMHFTAMAAANFVGCYSIGGPVGNTGSDLMPFAVAGVSLLIGVAALTGVWLEMRDRHRTEREAERMRGLANAAVEGLVVIDGVKIVTVNDSFQKLLGLEEGELIGRDITSFISNDLLVALRDQPETVFESDLSEAGGGRVPVEAILHGVEFAGKPQHAIAFRDLRDRKQAEQYIRFLARHDALTGLPNRAQFSERLERAVNSANRHASTLAVLCLDLDRFKEVNDLFGHAAGDALLERVGKILANILAGDQIAARLGGDEFAILLPEIDSPTEAGQVAARIIEAFETDVRESQAGAAPAASIGIAVFPDNGLTPTQLMNNADTALYRAKNDERGTYRFFENAMGVEVHDRRRLEHDLRHAITRGELDVYYQPQTRIDTGEAVGFEALLRWHHPDRGEISPAVFVPLAEETGLILSIGEWVLKTACQEAAGWENPLTIAVNVSTVQLHSRQFPDNLQTILRETGLSPRRLELEITETALVKDMARTLATLGKIKALGVRIAMDDFGTGYSSLSNLRAFSFDKIKVDQSFIRSVDSSEQSATIVRAVLGLGRGLNLPVLAEGVERLEELDFLRGEVCAEAQGFFFGRPRPIGEFRHITHGRTQTDAGRKKTGTV